MYYRFISADILKFIELWIEEKNTFFYLEYNRNEEREKMSQKRASQ